MNTKILLVAACLVCSLAAAARESNVKLNVKTGLWEITSTSRIGGIPPLPKELLAKLTPEQRAEMEAAFKEETAKGPQVDVDRECLTQEEIERPFESADAADCTQTIAATTRTTQEVRLVCTGEHKGSGVFRVTTPTPETMTGTLDLKMGEGKDVMTIQSQVKGRWLGPDCGDEDESADDESAVQDEDEAVSEEEEEE